MSGILKYQKKYKKRRIWKFWTKPLRFIVHLSELYISFYKTIARTLWISQKERKGEWQRQERNITMA